MDSPDGQRSSLDITSVEAILASGGPESPKQPPPAERIGSKAASLMSPPPRPDPTRAQPIPLRPRSTNRLSLSFPIQRPEQSTSTKPTPPPSRPSSALFSPSPELLPTSSPQDSNGFLVALAAQERRVLELKDELGRAEAELVKLKRQWAIHEANKKRLEIRHVEKLRPVQTVSVLDSPGSDVEDQNTVRRSVEMDRRKAILAAVAKDTRRKVMRGGHTRELSLLSGERSTHGQYYPMSSASDAGSEHSDSNTGLSRSYTMPDTSQGITKISSNKARNSYQGGAANGVKQIAEDFKAGLWTFMEDLRQATVGDDASKDATNPYGLSTNSTRVKKKVSKGSLNGHTRNKSDTRGTPKSRARENRSVRDTQKGVTSVSNTPGSVNETKQSVAIQREPAITAITGLDDDWSSWDSPASKMLESPSTASSSRNKETDNLMNNITAPLTTNEIPWPEMKNFSPSNLKRTASAFIKEFENSLTPPPGDRNELSPSASGTGDSTRERQREILDSNVVC